ncbi:MAG: type I methionyl aminopeptidase [Minisyncoccia bacterium]
MNFEEKIRIMQEGGEILKKIFDEIVDYIKIGIKTKELDYLVEKLLIKFNVKSAFKNFKPSFSSKPYPANLCVSINEEIVHGIPSEKIIKDGDIIKIDMGIIYKNLYLDSAFTLGIGNIEEKNKRLIEITKLALLKAINVAKNGNTLGDVGYEIQKTIEENGFKVIKNLCGHDIGEFLHGKLQVLNFGEKGKGIKIKEGMMFTIEPMASLGSNYAIQTDDFTFKTEDNSISSHFEVTLAILKDKNIVLTKLPEILWKNY